MINVQSLTDISWNNRSKFCNNRGERYCKYAMLFAGSFFREDAVQVAYYEYSHKELYPEDNNDQMLSHIFIPMSHDPRNCNPKSFSDYTSGIDLKVVLVLNPHDEPLKAAGEAIIWNGWWQEALSLGRVWQ